MNAEIRATALSLAINHHRDTGEPASADQVVSTASAFERYLAGKYPANGASSSESKCYGESPEEPHKTRAAALSG